MAMTTMAWKTKGMNKDLSVSAFNPEFSFDNRNLRLSTNEHNTQLSWVNERGTSTLNVSVKAGIITGGVFNWDYNISIEGTPIGTAILEHKLVLFTTYTDNDVKKDSIYVLKYYTGDNEEGLTGIRLYQGDLGFDTKFPLETLVSFEAEHIQKVYWIDGKNQPRLINIAVFDFEEEEQIKILTRWLNSDNTLFNFIPNVNLSSTLEVEKINGGGIFPPGVIQYCFSYFNKYCQQTNMVAVSPLYYLAYNDRGASPEDKVSCSFTIKIEDVDTNFEYLRLYAIQRTSLNMEVMARLVTDIPLKEGTTEVKFIDDGTVGSSIDPFEIMYIGGKEITALTMTSKDATLFMGNLELKNSSIRDIQDWFMSNPVTIHFGRDDVNPNSEEISIPIHVIDEYSPTDNKVLTYPNYNNHYFHTNTLDYNRTQISTFKGGEIYRFGFQLQKKTGEWSEPIYLNDETNPYYPKTKLGNKKVYLPYAYADIPIEKINTEVYSRIRPVIVYPTIVDRKVLCQGVLNPTVFNAEDRKEGLPFAQSSWYFRPYANSDKSDTEVINYKGKVSVELLHAGEDDIVPSIDIDSTPTPVDSADLQPYYVLTAVVENVDITIKRGALQIITCATAEDYADAIFSATNHTFSGVVCLNEVSSLYAFLSTEQWFPESDPTATPASSSSNTDPSFPFYYYVYQGLTSIHIPNTQTNLYKGRMFTKGGMFYFREDENTLGEKFITQINSRLQARHKVTFTAVPMSSDDVSTGSTAVFTHFSSLPNVHDSIKQVEVQGAEDIYENVYKSTKLIDYKCNTQFFVDQSIVTLNSPDIEFDTDVQNYPMENLKLRIVGIIPVTATTSSHEIIISSPMLETGHNLNLSGEVKEIFNFGVGELDKNVSLKNRNILAGSRLISDYLWNDVSVKRDRNNETTTGNGTYNYLVYPWHKAGALNNDYRSLGEASSLLKTKKEANLLFSETSVYNDGWIDTGNAKFENINAQIHLTQNDFVKNIRLKAQKNGLDAINYYPNIDKALYNTCGSPCKVERATVPIEDTPTPYSAWDAIQAYLGHFGYNPETIKTEGQQVVVPMKYKSTSHAVISLNASAVTNDNIPILPMGRVNTNEYWGQYIPPANAWNTHDTDDTSDDEFTGVPYWINGSTIVQYVQNSLDIDSLTSGDKYKFLWIGELYKDTVPTPFGGNDQEAIRNNTWLVGGESKSLQDTEVVDDNEFIELKWTEGDTYFQRFDCLKTYASTPDDINQIIEILSFMCETHVNIDGRYDRNRGQLNNVNMHPTIFNLINPIYSQQDNFYFYSQLNIDNRETLKYPNHIWYSKTKTYGADVDLWTNVTLASVLDLEGDKGALNKLTKLNDNIIALQDTGISQILFNENVQIAAKEGVPIEIANSDKVRGEKYISESVGCSNKWSVANTMSGIYFMDSFNKNIWLFNGQLTNLSGTLGFNTWAKNNIPSIDVKWSPDDFDNFVTYYDRINQDVMFINSKTCLNYSEKTATFTSFYDYGGTPYFCNFDNIGIWVREDSSIWKHQGGDYCKFFDTNYPYSMTLVGNPNPLIDKIFTNVEFRAVMYNINAETEITTADLPFDTIEAWNEYQHGIANLKAKDGHFAMMHHIPDNSKEASLKRKFRMWRCDIPRDNLGGHKLNRMRNPWVYLKLLKEKASNNSSLPRTEIHDMLMHYFV